MKINNTNSCTQPLKIQNKTLLHPADKAEALNEFFTSIASNISNDSDLPELPPLCPYKLSDINITDQDILDQFHLLNKNKPAGPDGILPKLIKNLSASLVYPLKLLFNYSLDNGKIPDILKTASVNAIYKGKGDSSDPNNYRPIAITSVFIKMLEKIIFKYTYNYVTKYNMISDHQSGFRPTDSTVNQLLYIYNDIISNLDKGNDCNFVFCDISKAFDRVWHSGLLYKLKTYGIVGKLFNWFKDYLSDRKQSVIHEGFKSNTKLITAGVPQGSVLGPFLFLLFINDISTIVSSNIKLFADDTSLYAVSENNDNITTANQLNEDLTSIANWASQWQILFNPSKTVNVNFTRKQNNPSPPIHFNNQQVLHQPLHKHLGLTLNAKGNWNDHISTIYEKASARLNILRLLKYKLDRNSLKKLYISYVRPILEYANTVWDNCSIAESNLLESVQIDAMRIITGLRRGTSHIKLYRECNLETLESRRHKHKLILMYKIMNNLTPPYLFQLVEPILTQMRHTTSEILDFSISQYLGPTCIKTVFFPNMMECWNNIDRTIRDAASLSSFNN